MSPQAPSHQRPVLASEGGFTLAIVMLALLVVLGLSVAAFGAAGGDLGLGQRSTDEKKAYAGAEAGLAYYLQKLSQDNDYWTKCTSDPDVASAQNPVNQPWTGVGTDPRVKKALPTDPTVSYTIELLPRAAQCLTTDNSTMLDPEQGTLRIRTTGFAGPPTRRVKRSIVTTLRRNGFLDFIYVTDVETSDPAQQVLSSPNSSWAGVRIKRVAPAAAGAAGAPPDDTIAAWADQAATCQRWYDGERYPDASGRSTAAYEGSGLYDADGGGAEPTQWNLTSRAGAYNISCSDIQFAPTDVVAGPFHTNDTIRACGSPTFGRAGRNDRIEFWSMVPTDGCGSATPVYNTPPKTGTDLSPLYPPPTNASLKQTVYQPYLFTGKTTITLNDQNMTVTSGGVTTTKPLPVNGLVYVQSDTTACPAWTPMDPYVDQPTCGDVYVKGTYGRSLTIAADRDIVVTGDLTQTTGSDSLLGLIANKYVRVEHKVASYPCGPSTADVNATPAPRTIEAAILSISHVFTVDNYQCGDQLGTLTVKGAIAQKYRGPVGTTGGTGYIKNYQYDDRLRFRSPPYFLAPVQSAWRPMRSTEQSPAR